MLLLNIFQWYCKNIYGIMPYNNQSRSEGKLFNRLQKRRRFSIRLYFFFMFVTSVLSTGWTDFDDSFFLWKLVLSVWSHWNLIQFWQWHPRENHLSLKFASSTCATNGRITQYNANWFRWFFFYWKGCTSRVVWWEFGKVLIMRSMTK